MAGTGKKWLIGCGVGCGGAILLVILVSIGASIFMMRPFDKAIDAQKILIADHGAREHYIPPVHGVTADRMQKFLAVRRAVLPQCAQFAAITEKFEAMEELDRGGDEPSKGEVFKAVGGLMGSIFGMVGDMGEFIRVRNAALVEQEMGLGEYIWIYVLVYHSWLQHPPSTSFEESAGGTGMSDADRRLLQTLTANYAEAFGEVGREAEAEMWAAESARMERSETGVPFGDGGLPPAVVADFEPYREELEALYCAATANLELNRIKKKGLSIHSE